MINNLTTKLVYQKKEAKKKIRTTSYYFPEKGMPFELGGYRNKLFILQGIGLFQPRIHEQL
jgi:hypothetical protein